MSQPLATSLEQWPIARLVQLIRHELDQGKINGLVASLKAGKQLPAIFVLNDGVKLSILDGHHRVAAWQAAGVQSAQVILFRAR